MIIISKTLLNVVYNFISFFYLKFKQILHFKVEFREQAFNIPLRP